MQKSNLNKEVYTASLFPVEKKIIDKTILDIQFLGEKVLDKDITLLGKTNPYLLSAIAGISNIFQSVHVEASCIQGALCMYHLASLSASSQQLSMPFVTERDMLTFVDRIDPGMSSLNTYIASEIAKEGLTDSGFLLKTITKAYRAFGLHEAELVAFGTGMVMTYKMLAIAQE